MIHRNGTCSKVMNFQKFKISKPKENFDTWQKFEIFFCSEIELV